MSTAKEKCDYIIENVLMQDEADIVLSRITELEHDNKQMLELLIEYLKSDFANGTDNLTDKNQELIQSITGKKIEEVLK